MVYGRNFAESLDGFAAAHRLCQHTLKVLVNRGFGYAEHFVVATHGFANKGGFSSLEAEFGPLTWGRVVIFSRKRLKFSIFIFFTETIQ